MFVQVFKVTGSGTLDHVEKTDLGAFLLRGLYVDCLLNSGPQYPPSWKNMQGARSVYIKCRIQFLVLFFY